MKREEEIKTASKEFASRIGSIRPELNADSFRKGAEWADKTMIKKACKWMKKWKFQLEGAPTERLIDDEMIEDFKKAMEEWL